MSTVTNKPLRILVTDRFTEEQMTTSEQLSTYFIAFLLSQLTVITT
ncbi:MAG: hypothetical protein ACSLEM_04720 [Candidatus Malihini olakiniferum]